MHPEVQVYNVQLYNVQCTGTFIMGEPPQLYRRRWYILLVFAFMSMYQVSCSIFWSRVRFLIQKP
jgi:hypothetical protein